MSTRTPLELRGRNNRHPQEGCGPRVSVAATRVATIMRIHPGTQEARVRDSSAADTDRFAVRGLKVELEPRGLASAGR
jgi:hypothetical protein